jgi:hypothetical protein
MKIKLSDSDLDFMNRHATIRTIGHIKSYTFNNDFLVDDDGTFEMAEKNLLEGLNGCYDEDFKSKQLIVRELIEEKGLSREKVKILVGDIIDKMCSEEKRVNGKHFWYCW